MALRLGCIETREFRGVPRELEQLTCRAGMRSQKLADQPATERTNKTIDELANQGDSLPNER